MLVQGREIPKHRSTYISIYQSNESNHMSVMKTSLTIFPCVPGSAFLYIRICPGLSFAIKRIGPPCCTLFSFVTCYPLWITLSQNYLLPIILVLVENTLLKTACHFLLLLVGFYTFTYRKDYDRSPILVGHQDSFLALLPGSEAPLVRKNLYSVLKFTVTCYYGK